MIGFGLWPLVLAIAGNAAGNYFTNKRASGDAEQYRGWSDQQFERDRAAFDDFKTRYGQWATQVENINDKNYARHRVPDDLLPLARQLYAESQRPISASEAFTDPSVALGTIPFGLSAAWNLLQGDMPAAFSNLAQGGMMFGQGYNSMRHRRQAGIEAALNHRLHLLGATPWLEKPVGPYAPHVSQKSAPIGSPPSMAEMGTNLAGDLARQLLILQSGGYI